MILNMAAWFGDTQKENRCYTFGARRSLFVGIVTSASRSGSIPPMFTNLTGDEGGRG